MKKIIIYTLLFSSCLLVFNNCKKSEENIDSLNSKVSAEKNPVIQKIDSFRDKMNSSLKSGGSMSVDSSIWYLEALINYDIAYPDSSAKYSESFYSNYTVPVGTNGLVTESDVQLVYNQMLDSISYQLSLINNDVKFLVFADIKLDRIENNTAYYVGGFGYGFQFILNTYWPFNDDDDWIWGTITGPFSGMCDGTEIGVSDGSNELEWRINNPAADSPPVTYSNIETVEVYFLNCYYEEPPELHRVYENDDNLYCLHDTELTELIQHAHYIIYDYNEIWNDDSWAIIVADGEGARPDGKDFINISIIDNFISSTQGVTYYHQYFITYGTPTYGGTN